MESTVGVRDVEFEKAAAASRDSVPPPGRFGAGRLAREWKTIGAMVHRYCRDHHGTQLDRCPECKELVDYAAVRLARCRFGLEKPTCAKCPIHCYQRQKREQIREVMRYAGPRMLWEHPMLSLRHWVDSWRRCPPPK